MLLAIFLLPACSGSREDSAPPPPPGPGTLALSFRMNADEIPNMTADGEAPVGTFGGSIFAEADATGLGPDEGAVPLLDFAVASVDLTVGGGPSAVLHVTEPLEAQIVWVLGCLDVADDGCGDAGDPITVPGPNKVIVVAESETPFEVYMGMLRP